MERRTIGQILRALGRISDEDVQQALDYQRENGGYFGEALLACGLVTEDELEFGLASQYDLPLVFPEADAIDPEAAALVTPEWALANLALPILMTEQSLTVILESPLNTDLVKELESRAGERSVELALASGSTIRDLIRQVYARAAAAEEEHGAPIGLSEVVDEVLSVEAPRHGVSVRGSRASVWWDERGTIRRRPLAGDWLAALERMLSPGPERETAGRTRARWNAELTRAGVVRPYEVRFITDESGSEYLFEARPVEAREARFPQPPDGVVSEVRLLARSGDARFIVTTEPLALGHDILPHLPSLLLDETWRSVYLNATDQAAAGEAFSVKLPDDPGRWSEELEELRAFHFDVVTVDLSGGEHRWTSDALDVASVALLLWPAGADTAPAYDAGIRWRLHIAVTSAAELDWSLEPLRS